MESDMSQVSFNGLHDAMARNGDIPAKMALAGTEAMERSEGLSSGSSTLGGSIDVVDARIIIIIILCPIADTHPRTISDLFFYFSCCGFLDKAARPFARDHRGATSGTTQKLETLSFLVAKMQNESFLGVPFFSSKQKVMASTCTTRLGKIFRVLRRNFVKFFDLKAARDSSGRGWTFLHSTPFPRLICHVFREVPRTGWDVNRGSRKGLSVHQQVSASTSILTSPTNFT